MTTPTTHTTESTRRPTRATNPADRRPTTRDYPNNEENMEAPLVPFVADPTRPDPDEELRGLRRDITALRAQLTRLETRMREETTDPETEERR
ncbi:hypothetical protein [Halogeometricum limi]|uniref:Uncharacterized protein n=1 Tax=Halogeometricum limi TaxID=555875 RepID=A0A1I6H9E7_9EURY|nr:hypothetical protein [Halogeometricum limi]SFR51115.1 hypothetical protein SAMN04488124_1952 [Halogeometricum limi]